MASEFLRFLLSALIYGESPTGQNGGGSHHWSYRGEAGPSNWSMLYPTCSGTRQSPVDLRDRNIIYQDLPPFHFNGFHGQGGSFTLTNNGHTASIAVVGNLTVEGGGLDGMYKTAELHFHWGSSNNFGSEHSINGRKYPLEMHIVNYAVKYGNLTNAMKYRDGLAVLGTFFDVTEENPYFRSIEFGLRSAKYAGNYTRLHPVNLYGLLPRDTTRYYRYYGSLTTPPCFQSVMWTLFEDIQHLSPYQMRLLRQLYESHHDSHGDGHHQGGHGLNGHMKAHFPVEQFLMDNFRPIQPHFDRVINCNIPRYADPNFIQRSRQQGRGPQHLDFISQRISQVNADALLNKTLSKWLLSKGLPSDMLTQEQLALQSRGLFESQRNTNFDHNAVPNHHQSSGFNTGHDEGIHGGHRRPFVGQGSGHNVLNPSQQHHNPPPPLPPVPPNPSQLDLQVIQTQRIGPDGQQVSEIQVQVDAASGVSQEQLQVLLEDPSIMDQIQQIIQQQGGVNQTHEIIVSRPPQLNQQMGTQGSQQQFGGQLPQHQHQHQHHHQQQQQQQQQQQPAGQGSTMLVDQTAGSQVRTVESPQGQTEVHVLEFPPNVPKYLIDELLRHSQWSYMYNQTLIEIRDYITDLNARGQRQPPPPDQHQQQQHQQVFHQQQPQQQQQFQTLPVQRVQPELIQGQGVQVAHLQGVQMDLQGVHVDHAAPSQTHRHFGQQVINQPRTFNQGQGRVIQSQGQFFTQQNTPVQDQMSSFSQPQQQQGTVVIGQPGTYQLDPFIAMTGNIQVDPIQSFNIGQNTGIQSNPVEVSHRRTQTFQQSPQNLQIVSAREMNLIG